MGGCVSSSFCACSVGGYFFFFSSRRRHTRLQGDWNSDVCSSDLRVAREIAGADQVNVLGFCIGGTLLGAALAVLATKGDEQVASATFLTTMLDFSDTGQIGLFVDPSSVALRESAIGGGGVMPGSELAQVFSSLRANDLVWPYV